MTGKRITKATNRKQVKGAAKAATRRSATGSKRPDAQKVREQLVTTVLKNGKPIVAAVVKEAKKGKYLPAKYLFEFAKISEPLPVNDEQAEERAQSLADILMGATQNECASANTSSANLDAPNPQETEDKQEPEAAEQKTS